MKRTAYRTAIIATNVSTACFSEISSIFPIIRLNTASPNISIAEITDSIVALLSFVICSLILFVKIILLKLRTTVITKKVITFKIRLAKKKLLSVNNIERIVIIVRFLEVKNF